MVYVKMVGGRLWNAKQDEEQAKALVKEDLAVAMHRDASLLVVPLRGGAVHA